MGDAHLRRAFQRRSVQRALPAQPRQGADRSVRRLRPADADGLRPRPRAQPWRGRQGRRADQPHRRHAAPLRPDPPRRDEHVDDDQRRRDVHARALPGRRRGAGRGRRAGPRRGARPPGRHDAERHHQGVPEPRDLRLPARALDAPHHRHGDLHRRRDPQVEPDQHLQLPPAGGRGDSRPGDRLLDVHRARRARRRQGVRPGARGGLRQGRRADLLLRQRRRALRRGDVQDARLRRALGRDLPRALRRHRPQAAPLPLRRPGQQPRTDRGPAGKQRPADRPRDARGHAEQGRARPRRPAARVERGARPAPPVGPAVVAAPAAGPRLRVRPARVRRPLRRLAGRGEEGRRARRGGPRPRSSASRTWAAPCRPSSPGT